MLFLLGLVGCGTFHPRLWRSTLGYFLHVDPTVYYSNRNTGEPLCVRFYAVVDPIVTQKVEISGLSGGV